MTAPEAIRAIELFACPKCGAPARKKCASKAGKPAPVHIHRLRLLDTFVETETALPGADAFDEAPQKAWDAQVVREERIQQVIWGIEFARKHLGTSQETIDRNLAEMLVDAELDLRLF